MYEKGLQYNIINSSSSAAASASASASASYWETKREREREREDREGLSDHFRSDGQKGLFVKFPNFNWLSQEEEKEKKGVRLSLYIHTYIHTYYTYHT